MKKKFLSVVLTAALALSSVASAGAETLNGSDGEWWLPTNETQAYTLTGDGEVTFGVNVNSGNSSGYAAFTVRIDGQGTLAEPTTGFITTTSIGTSWYWAAAGDPINVSTTGEQVANAGDNYTVTVTRSGSDFTIAYKNNTSNTTATHVAKNTTFAASDAKVHIIPKSGSYDVTASGSTESISTGNSSDIELSDGDSVEYTVDVKTAGEFWVEIYGDAYACATGSLITGSDKNAWYADGITGDSIQGKGDTIKSVIKANEYYTVKVARVGQNFTITYYKADGVEKYMEIVANNTNALDTVNVVFVAQVGQFDVTKVGDDSVISTPKTFAQYKKNSDNTYTVRFISEVSISDLKDYDQVGFICTNGENSEKGLGNTVYESVVANGKIVTPSETGKYFVVVEVQNVPANASFSIQPCGIENGKTEVTVLGTESAIAVDMTSIIK